ncbi:MAG: helix-turn-helix domain-containing protein [Euryarchaeota archaeon]|nr:helix-turn-helix domain-containing protein [Euryarchaeota archaeon]MDE1836729.1 helix-turn-helix domain-containing protein [Euryarchaeota archaeon]MDE1881758.1 helix-turn-helix domain-containing protein [Euryarchaeota archaeon]MDE2044713.1 helix-turn-helix domain-containing protein [Thermoplasmata archaeon]
MQTVTLEMPTEALVALGLLPEGFFRQFEELELVETLGLEPRWRLQVLRLRSRGPPRSSRELSERQKELQRTYDLERLELLESRPRSRDQFFLVRQRNPGPVQSLVDLAGGEVFPGRPFLLRERTTLASLRGDPKVIRRLLERLKGLEVPYRLRRVRGGVGPAEEEPDAVALTPRQVEVLREAARRGFYDVPRKTSLSELARRLHRSPAAVGKVLRRAEGTLAQEHLRRVAPAATEAD